MYKHAKSSIDGTSNAIAILTLIGLHKKQISLLRTYYRKSIQLCVPVINSASNITALNGLHGVRRQNSTKFILSGIVVAKELNYELRLYPQTHLPSFHIGLHLPCVNYSYVANQSAH